MATIFWFLENTRHSWVFIFKLVKSVKLHNPILSGTLLRLRVGGSQLCRTSPRFTVFGTLIAACYCVHSNPRCCQASLLWGGLLISFLPLCLHKIYQIMWGRMGCGELLLWLKMSCQLVQVNRTCSTQGT